MAKTVRGAGSGSGSGGEVPAQDPDPVGPPPAPVPAAETAVRVPGAAPRRHPPMWGWLAAGAALIYVLYAPVLLLDSVQRTLAGVFMFAALAQGWNIIGGFAGYPCFGQVVFFGLGGYTAAVLMVKAGWAFWPTLPLATVIGTVFAVLVGTPLLRLRGHYFAIATLGVAEGMHEVVVNLPSLTGGGAGITMPVVGSEARTSYLSNTGFYYAFLCLLVVATTIVWLIARSRFGYALRAIHQDEEAAASAGIHTPRAKVIAFALSGALTATIGAVYAFQQVTIFPDRLFAVDITVLMAIMVIFGGSGTVTGPIIGGVTLQLLSEYLRQNYLQLHTLLFGAIIVLAVLFIPQGVVEFVTGARYDRRFSLLENMRRYRL